MAQVARATDGTVSQNGAAIPCDLEIQNVSICGHRAVELDGDRAAIGGRAVNLLARDVDNPSSIRAERRVQRVNQIVDPRTEVYGSGCVHGRAAQRTQTRGFDSIVNNVAAIGKQRKAAADALCLCADLLRRLGAVGRRAEEINNTDKDDST